MARNVSPLLNRFLQEYHGWAQGQPIGPWQYRFAPDTGLCANYRRWLVWNNHDTAHTIELSALLRYTTGSMQYPFSGRVDYHLECADCSSHRNPLRLQWVQQHMHATTFDQAVRRPLFKRLKTCIGWW